MADRFHRRDGSTFDDPVEFADLMADEAYRRVALTAGDGWSVSTVFLGIDYGFGLTAVPLLYETLAECDETERIERYPNEIAALAGHDQWVQWCRDFTRADRTASSEEYPSTGQSSESSDPPPGA